MDDQSPAGRRRRSWLEVAAGHLLASAFPAPGGWRSALSSRLPEGAALVILAYDFLAAASSFPLACALRLGTSAVAPPPPFLISGTALFAVIALASLLGLGVHRGLWRHVSMADLAAIVRAATLAILAFLPALFMIDRLTQVPRTVPVIQWLILVALLGAPRFALRAWAHLRPHQDGPAGLRSPVLLVGVGEGSALLIRAIAVDATQLYRVVGVLDLGAAARGRNIEGVPVLGSTDELGSIASRLTVVGLRPTRIVLTEPADGSMLRRLVRQAEALDITIARLPSLVEFRAAVDDGRIELQPIALQELLGRPQVTFDQAVASRLIEGRRVLVTGAGGSIGSELVRQIAGRRPATLVLLDNSEFNLYVIDQEVGARFPELARTTMLLDVRARAGVRRAFEQHRPELVFHTAALKHVPIVEEHPIEGVQTNALGSRNVADAARACGSQAMVLISTDKAVNPTSVMGATKRLAELYCQALDVAAANKEGAPSAKRRPRFMTVRFGNVLGSSGSVVALFRRQLAEGGPLTVTHPEMRRYFMTVREAVELVLQASAYGLEQNARRGEVFVLDMGEPIRIVDLARQMIRLAGKEPERDVQIEFTGLRPGERLAEELFDATELQLPAVASGVLAALPRYADGQALGRAFADLARACMRGDEAMLRATLGSAVPGYSAASAMPRAGAGAQRHEPEPALLPVVSAIGRAQVAVNSDENKRLRAS